MSIAVYLPPELLAHIRHVFLSEPDFLVATSWTNLDDLIRDRPVSVVILDPSADGIVNIDAVASILNRFPSLPLVGYVTLTPKSFGAIAQLSRRGLDNVVLHRFDDSRERLQQMVGRLSADPATTRMLDVMTPMLRMVPLPVARAVREMFDKPHRYLSVLDLAMTAGCPTVTLYRQFDTAKLPSPKKLLIAAKLMRGLTYLRDPGYAVRDVAAKLGYRTPRIFAAHAVEVFNVTPARLRSRISADDALAHMLRWLDLPETNRPPRQWPS
jgi:AraC-like DNA-binding protein